MPELVEPPSPPFKLGESVPLGRLDVDAVLVITRDIVLLPLIVTMVVVMAGADSGSVVGAAVVVIREVWLSRMTESSEVGVGVSLVGVFLVGVGVGVVGVVDVEGSSFIVVRVEDTVAGGEDGVREVVVVCVDRDVAEVDDSDSASAVAETEGVEPPVPAGVF